MPKAGLRTPITLVVATLGTTMIISLLVFLVGIPSPFAAYWAQHAAYICVLTVALVLLPSLLALRAFGHLSFRTNLLVATMIGLLIAIARFLLSDGGTDGYTYYGEGNYRFVEMGRLTTAGIVRWFVTSAFVIAMGSLAGTIFWAFGARVLVDRKRP